MERSKYSETKKLRIELVKTITTWRVELIKKRDPFNFFVETRRYFPDYQKAIKYFEYLLKREGVKIG